MCSITMQCVHITMVVVGKQFVLCIMNVCLYSCPSYLACKSHIMLSSVAYLTPPYFSTYLINSTILREK